MTLDVSVPTGPPDEGLGQGKVSYDPLTLVTVMSNSFGMTSTAPDASGLRGDRPSAVQSLVKAPQYDLSSVRPYLTRFFSGPH